MNPFRSSSQLARGSARTIVLMVIVLAVLASQLALPLDAAAVELFSGCPPGDQACEALSKELKATSPITSPGGTRTTPGPAAPPPNVPCGTSDLGCWLLKVLNWVVDVGFALPFLIAQYFFSWMLDVNFSFFAPENPGGLAVGVGFPIALGVANMFFVLILLWIAIATIFDFEPFTARQLLLKLIIAALLINFSLPIGRAIINLSNGIGAIFHDNLIQASPTGTLRGIVQKMFRVEAIQRDLINPEEDSICRGLDKPACLSKIYDTTAHTEGGATISATQCAAPGILIRAPQLSKARISAICDELTGKAKLEASKVFDDTDKIYRLLATMIAAKVIVYPIAIFVLFAAAIFLLVRIVSLTFILILGPLAFLFMILPATRRFYDDWWERLFRWSFFFPAFLFFFWLSFKMIDGIPDAFYTIQFAGKSTLGEMSAMGVYLLAAAFVIGSLMVANQLGIAGAGTVTGWGQKLAGATGKWVRDRGWKYAGKAAEQVAKIPGVGRIAPLRAGVTAVMKKGAAVEKKDIDFYTKLPDRQLAATLSTMPGARARALWEALPAQRRRTARPELAEFARGRGWPGAPPAGPQPLSGEQTQTLQDQTAQIVRSMPIFQNLPQNIQQAVIQGMQQAVQNLPAGASHQAATQAITQTAQGIARQQARGNVSAENMARGFAAELGSAPRQTEIQNVMQAIIPAPPPRAPRPTREEELREEIAELREELGGEIGELRERRT